LAGLLCCCTPKASAAPPAASCNHPAHKRGCLCPGPMPHHHRRSDPPPGGAPACWRARPCLSATLAAALAARSCSISACLAWMSSGWGYSARESLSTAACWRAARACQYSCGVGGGGGGVTRLAARLDAAVSGVGYCCVGPHVRRGLNARLQPAPAVPVSEQSPTCSRCSCTGAFSTLPGCCCLSGRLRML